MEGKEVAAWLNSLGNKAPFLDRFAPDAALKPQTYSLIIQFVPLHFRPNSNPDLSNTEEANQLPRNAILRAQWIKPAYRWAPGQMCRHMLAIMTRPMDANMILTNSLVICQKQVVSSIKYTAKCLCHMHWLSPISLIIIGILPIIHSLYFSCFCTAEALWTPMDSFQLYSHLVRIRSAA